MYGKFLLQKTNDSFKTFFKDTMRTFYFSKKLTAEINALICKKPELYQNDADQDPPFCHLGILVFSRKFLYLSGEKRWEDDKLYTFAYYRPPEGDRLYDMKVVSGYAFLRTYYVQKK